jgi:MFS family permease
LQQYVEGLRYLRQHADIFWITMLKTATGLSISGGFQVVQVALSQQVFVIGQGGGTSLGLMYAMVGVGTGLGPIVARRFTGDHIRPMRLAIIVAFLIGGAGLLMIVPLASFGWVLVGSLLRGIGAGVVWVFSTQLLLLLTPAQVRGRVFSSDFAGQTLASALSAGAGGWLLDHTALGVPGTLIIMAALTILFGVLWAAWTTLRAAADSRTDAPAAEQH